jgi:hypothetical protein
MIKVCPQPIPWNDVYQALLQVWEKRPDMDKPPTPLILNGWVFSNDIEKMNRWQETLEWSKKSGCEAITHSLAASDFYCVEQVSTHMVGPLGGPSFRSWDTESKKRPDDMDLDTGLQKLVDGWPQIAPEISGFTRPLGFTGAKARRLIVKVTTNASPPWGSWDNLSKDENRRRTFTAFRKTVNAVLNPHEVDHVDFVRKSERKISSGHKTASNAQNDNKHARFSLEDLEGKSP